jgi:hypothetical protein
MLAAVILETPGPPADPSVHAMAGSTSVMTVRVKAVPAPYANEPIAVPEQVIS